MSVGPAGYLFSRPTLLTWSHVAAKETRSINTARAVSVWRKCPGQWCVRLTHVWRGKMMTMLCVRNNARGRAILVGRLLLVDTVISWFDLHFVDVGLNAILCGFRFTICLLIVNPNKVSFFFAIILWGCLDKRGGWIDWWVGREGGSEGGRDRHTDAHGHR